MKEACPVLIFLRNIFLWLVVLLLYTFVSNEYFVELLLKALLKLISDLIY